MSASCPGGRRRTRTRRRLAGVRRFTKQLRSPLPLITLLQVRHVIYHKGLEAEFDIVSPAVLGGLGSDSYKAVNPQGKMPILLLPDGSAIPESEVSRPGSAPTRHASCARLCHCRMLPQVIVQYILDKHDGSGPSLRAATPELRAVAALATRIHDQYITPIQVSA